MTIAAKNAKSAKALLWFLICAFLRALRQKIILCASAFVQYPG